MINRPGPCALLLALSPVAAFAQPAPSAPVEERDLDSVLVTAPVDSEVRSEIDRRSYGVASEIQAQSGTLADLLRTLPSVDVDPQGNVTLRGDAGVQITIDGRPAGMFRGEGRGQAIQSLPADQFERVEVITNPSAADSPEGAAGIINLVSKTPMKRGLSGSARLKVGTLGQYASGASLSYNTAKLALTADASYRGRDPLSFDVVEARQYLSPRQGAGSLATFRLRGMGSTLASRVSADYDLDARNRIGVSARYQEMPGTEPTLERYESFDGAGPPSVTLRDIGPSNFWNETTEGSLSYRRKFAPDHEFSADLSQSRSTNKVRRFDRTAVIAPPAPDTFGLYIARAVSDLTAAKLKYRRPLSSGGEFNAGYDLQIDDNRYWNLVARGDNANDLIANPGLTGAFAYEAEIHAAFATLRRTIDDLNVLAGLRYESAKVHVGATGLGAHDSRRRRAYPSLHLTYPVGEEAKLSASYSRRIQRPNPLFVSPLIFLQSNNIIQRGNPRLKPADIDSLEVGYENTAGHSLTVFHRRTHDTIARVNRPTDDRLLLFTWENIGLSTQTGVSVSIRRKLNDKLTASLSGDAYWTRLPALSPSEPSRYGLSGKARASLSWQATDADFFQADVRIDGPTLTPQGRQIGSTVVNVGYRRRLTPTLFAVVAGENILDTWDFAEKYRTPTYVLRRGSRGLPATVTFGLTYNFGGGPKAAPPPEFEFPD